MEPGQGQEARQATDLAVPPVAVDDHAARGVVVPAGLDDSPVFWAHKMWAQKDEGRGHGGRPPAPHSNMANYPRHGAGLPDQDQPEPLPVFFTAPL